MLSDVEYLRLSALVCDLEKSINKINRANGWDTPDGDTLGGERADKLPRLLCLVHSEVSEALEAYRRKDYDNFAEELADIMIRVLDISGGLGVNLVEEIRTKLIKNKARGLRHGGKVV